MTSTLAISLLARSFLWFISISFYASFSFFWTRCSFVGWSWLHALVGIACICSQYMAKISAWCQYNIMSCRTISPILRVCVCVLCEYSSVVAERARHRIFLAGWLIKKQNFSVGLRIDNRQCCFYFSFLDTDRENSAFVFLTSIPIAGCSTMLIRGSNIEFFPSFSFSMSFLSFF